MHPYTVVRYGGDGDGDGDGGGGGGATELGKEELRSVRPRVSFGIGISQHVIWSYIIISYIIYNITHTREF